jgi:hypothetical protein
MSDARIAAGQVGVAIDLAQGQDAAIQFDDFELRATKLITDTVETPVP